LYIGSGDNKIHVRKKSKYNQNKSLKYIKLIKKTFTITKNKKIIKLVDLEKKAELYILKNLIKFLTNIK
jgi:hypothetical protein